jgi:hypothetical protein
VVHLVSTLCSAVISARAELGSIIVSALPVATVLTHQRVCVCVGAQAGVAREARAREACRRTRAWPRPVGVREANQSVQMNNILLGELRTNLLPQVRAAARTAATRGAAAAGASAERRWAVRPCQPCTR